MQTIDPADLISQSKAARILGLTRQAVFRAMERGRLPVYEIAGKRLILRQDAEKYKLMREKRRMK